MKNTVLIFMALVLPLLVCGQLSRKDAKLAGEVYDVTNEMMRANWKEVPQQHDNQSAVFLELIRHETHELKMTTLKNTVIFRMVVKINDKSGLDNFSTLNVSEQFSQSGTVRVNQSEFIRLIKGGTGEIVEVDVSSLERNADKEIAVPGLEVGDILDFAFIAEVKGLVNGLCSEDEIVRLNRAYPIVHGMHRLDVEPNFFVNFRWFNGNKPMFVNESKSTGRATIYDLEFENIAPQSSEFWAPRYLNTDSYHYQVCAKFAVREPGQLLGRIKTIKTEATDAELEDAFKKVFRATSNRAAKDPNVALFYTWLKKNYGKEKLTPEQTMEGAFNFLRYYVLIFDANTNKYRDDYEGRFLVEWYFVASLMAIAKKRKVEAEIVFAPRRYRGTLEEIVTQEEYDMFVRFKDSAGGWQYIYRFYSYDTFGTSSENYEGQRAVGVGARAVSKIEAIPATTHRDNIYSATYSISPDFDGRLVEMKTRTHLTGLFKHDLSRVVLVNTGFHTDVEDNLLPDGRPDKLLEDRKMTRGRQGSAASVEAEQSEKLNQLKKIREKDFDLNEYTNFSLVSSGVRNRNDSLVFAEQFSVQNAINKAGNNFVIDLGKLVIGQVVVPEEQRGERGTNIFMDYAKTYRYAYELAIPDGYSLEGYDDLEQSVENDFGKIEIKTVKHNDKLVIVIEKVYKQPNASASAWAKYLEFLLPAMKINSVNLVYKKVA